MKPDEYRSPETPRFWNRFTPYAEHAALRLRSAFSRKQSSAPQRIAPRMRFIQVGASLAAAGVLGVAVGNSGAEPEQPNVQLAAEAAPAPAQAPAQAQAQAQARSSQGHSARSATPRDPIDGWINEATTVLERNGYPAHQLDRDAIRTIIVRESAGNPAASNNWDSNASAGTPSKGVMQTIDPTFRSYALPGHDDIWDPVDNIIAATRYSVDRYGSVSSVPGVSGLRSGGSYQGY